MFLLNDIVLIESVLIKPRRNEEVEGIGSGQIIRAELTTPLWEVDINTPLTTFADGRRIRALINRANVPGASFRVYDPIAQYPLSDPTGAVISGATVQVNSVDAQGRISFANSPEGFVYQPGDVFHVDYGGRRGYFEINSPATTNASGVTPVMTTTPPVPAGVAALSPVTLVRPEIRVQIVPDQLSYGLSDSATWKMGGFTIRAIQKL